MKKFFIINLFFVSMIAFITIIVKIFIQNNGVASPQITWTMLISGSIVSLSFLSYMRQKNEEAKERKNFLNSPTWQKGHLKWWRKQIAQDTGQ